MASAIQPTVRIFTRGDVLVSLYARLDKADGSIPSLGGTVSFYMKSKKTFKDPTAPRKVDGASADIVDAATRSVKYDWEAADVDTVGDYYAWFVNETTGGNEHFPGQGAYLVVKIVEAEGDPTGP